MLIVDDSAMDDFDELIPDTSTTSKSREAKEGDRDELRHLFH
jgi:hypothetical protein